MCTIVCKMRRTVQKECMDCTNAQKCYESVLMREQRLRVPARGHNWDLGNFPGGCNMQWLRWGACTFWCVKCDVESVQRCAKLLKKECKLSRNIVKLCKMFKKSAILYDDLVSLSEKISTERRTVRGPYKNCAKVFRYNTTLSGMVAVQKSSTPTPCIGGVLQNCPGTL